MSVTPRTFTAVLAGAVLLAGLLGLFWMVRIPSPADTDERLICGIGLVRSPSFERNLEDALQQPLTGVSSIGALFGGPSTWAQECASRTATRRLWAWPAAVVGGVVLLGTAVARKPGSA